MRVLRDSARERERDKLSPVSISFGVRPTGDPETVAIQFRREGDT